MHLNRWILGGLGFALRGPIGALIGVTIAILLEEKLEKLDKDQPAEDQPKDNDRRFVGGESTNYRRATVGDIRVSLIVLIACVMKADGQVKKSEVNHIKPFLVKNYGEEGARDALQLLKELLQKDINPVGVSRQIAQHVNYSTRLEILHLLLDVAMADGEMADSEVQVVETIVEHMGIQPMDYRSLLAMYRRDADPNWAYTALEITPQATDEEVKRAYRRMAMKYHPDKVSNAGEEVQRSATEKFRIINQAYETIKTARGIV